jgi:energy-coupling factor transport system ATP-binding protein
MEPDFLIFDEPTAGLDPVGCEQMLSIFKKLHQNGKTVIIVTHNLDHVLQITEKTMLFHEGKLIKFEDSYSILSDINFLEKNNMQPPKLLEFVNKLEKKGHKIGKVTTIKQLVRKLVKTQKKEGGQ